MPNNKATPPPQPLKSSLTQYMSTIDDAEIHEYKFSTVQGVLLEIQLLSAHGPTPSGTVELGVLTPFISFVDRYSAAVDMMVQNFGAPSCLIWGCLRVILKVTSLFDCNCAVGRSMPFYFTDLLRLVERFGAQLCLYNRYDALFNGHDEFMAALSDTYMDAIIFLRKARDALHANGCVTAWLRRVWANFEQDFDTITERLGRRVEHLDRLSTFIHRDAAHTHMKAQEEFRAQATRAVQDRLGWDILSWLTPADYDDDWRRGRQMCAPDTSRWIFQHAAFKTWAGDTGPRMGWVVGSAGMGKTVLCASVLEKLKGDVAADGVVVAHFFFDERDDSRSTALAMDALWIRDRLATFDVLTMTVTPELTKPDIEVYFTIVVNNLSIPPLADDERHAILNQLCGGADALFLCARLLAGELQSATCLDDLYAAATACPGALNQYYAMSLKRLAQEPQRVQALARGVFTRVLCSPRPLTWPELQCSLSLGLDGADVQDSKCRLPYKAAVLRVCQPFIEHDTESDIFRPAHLSVHQFLTVPTDDSLAFGLPFHLDIGNQCIAKVTLDYLMQIGTPEAHADARAYPLRAYATSYWCQHLVDAQLDAALRQKAAQFLSSDEKRRAWLMHRLLLRREAFPTQAMVGILSQVRRLLKDYSNDGGFKMDELEDMVVILVTLEEGRIQSQSAVPISRSDMLMIIRDLARLYTAAGRVDDGIRHFVASRARLDHLTGARPHDSVWLLNGFGILHDQAGHVDLAIATQREALAILDASGLCGDLDRVLTINELGRLYRHQGNYVASEEMHLEALRILQPALPDADVQVIWTKAHLARCYRRQCRFRDACALHEQVLAARKSLVGAEHPHALWDLSDVAKCQSDMGDFDTALRLQAESVRLRDKTLGRHHNDTLWAQNDLGIMYERAGRRRDALEAHQRAWEGQERTLGRDHGTTVWSLQRIRELETALQNAES
ncbi:Nephrocystin-3 [Beauveria bassiana]|uniref:Nephrocystin-3 n=1 Tax=Beauveria bassiana TaxID=176275 RepID=A0A2N6ND30_BEABA|nr:Nephrocystin-3 [Beauveria bassiana]